MSDVIVEVEQGETIVRAGDRITQLHLETLDELGLTRPRLEASTIGGNALIALILATLLVGFLWRFEPQIWFRNRSLLLFGLALLGSVVAVKVAADRALWAYVVPTGATVLLATILLNGAAGAAMAVALAVMAGVMNGVALEPAVYTLAGGAAAMIAMVRAERLNAFVRAGLLLAVTNIAVLTAFGLLDQRDVAGILQGIAAGIGQRRSGGSAGGRLLCRHRQPVRDHDRLPAPGAGQPLLAPAAPAAARDAGDLPPQRHGRQPGRAAAETIGADPLLARVAAYYHDIGKMKNPLAFIENQAGAHNIHDDLSAEVSARIISGHIKDGIDLGYENGLPVQIIGFIPQHHGTSVMSYFYGKALAEVSGNDELVPKDVFRYPGPKPQSREAAILMLADGVEASVRSLDDKDEASIRGMVDRIVDARVEDGQLDDADLTLKNIAQIKDAFVQQLLGMYHSRIKYPDNVVPLEQRREA